MPAYNDPAALRRKLTRELRRYRISAGVTQNDVAKALDWSTSKVIRIEQGLVLVTTNDLRALLQHYGERDTAVVDELVDISRAAKAPSPWARFVAEGSISSEAATYFGHEASAALVRHYEPNLLPGLIQTEDYMREILPHVTGRTGHLLESSVEARLLRQTIFERDAAPEFFFIVDECALRRNIGSPRLMQQQLGHLIGLNRRSEVTLQVVGYSAGAYEGLNGPFALLEFTDDDPVLYIENQIELVTSEQAEHIAQYLDLFQKFEREIATPPDQVESILLKIMQDWSSRATNP
jgi:transcriptional regulator with XRE-family HTH domain